MLQRGGSAGVVDLLERPLRVMVVDDHRSYAEAVSLALGRSDGIGAVQAQVSFHDALLAVHRDTPDVVLLDWQLPDVEGTEAIRAIRAARPDTAVVLITGHAGPDLTRLAVRAGASCVLPKESSVGEIVAALHRSAHGQVLGDPAPGVGQGRDDVDDLELDRSLSRRETQVLQLLAAGRDAPQIARELFLSVHTVRGYVKDLRQRFGAHTQLELVAIARRRRLLPD